MALKDCVNQWGTKDFVYGPFPPVGARLFTKNNTSNYTTLVATFTDMEGYKWTWEANGSTDNVVKATDAINYKIFPAAANYDPGIITEHIGKWYLPAAGEFITLLKALNRSTSPLIFNSMITESPYSNFADDVNSAFTNAGGEKLLLEVNYWTSSEFNNQTSILRYRSSDKKIVISSGAARHNSGGYVRPFVHF